MAKLWFDLKCVCVHVCGTSWRPLGGVEKVKSVFSSACVLMQSSPLIGLHWSVLTNSHNPFIKWAVPMNTNLPIIGNRRLVEKTYVATWSEAPPTVCPGGWNSHEGKNKKSDLRYERLGADRTTDWCVLFIDKIYNSNVWRVCVVPPLSKWWCHKWLIDSGLTLFSD